VLYSDKENKILSFSKTRKHISRSGSFMGTLQDSLPHEWEHLMIVFFDILVLDDNPILRQSLQERRRILKDVMQIIPGRSMRSEWTLIDFKEEDGTIDLKQAFARTLADRQEGIILKPLHAPYFPLLCEVGQRQPGYFIKLKKDYLNDMGEARDLGDFAIIGASYDIQVASKSDLKNLHWTHYHLGCLTNKSAVERVGARPKFKVVGALSLDKCIPKSELKYLNDNGYLQQVSFRPNGSIEQFDIENTYGYDYRMSVAFKRPFVAEILGSGYEKAQNESFEMLRHPRIKKIHHDRTWEDTVTMEELERMAGERWEVPDSDALDGHAKDVALLVKKYVEETSQSQFTTSEYETTQETTQRTTQRSSQRMEQESTLHSPARTTQESALRNSTRTMAESARVLEDEEVIEETPQCTSQSSWATISTTQVSNSTQGVGIKASREIRILVREDTSERIPVDPTPIPTPISVLNAAVIPTSLISSAESNGPSTIKRRQSLRELIISPPMSKRRKIRTPLKDAGTCRNLGAFDWDSQEKTLHIYADEGWKVQVHSCSEKSR
jgi:DNA ligase-4